MDLAGVSDKRHGRSVAVGEPDTVHERGVHRAGTGRTDSRVAGQTPPKGVAAVRSAGDVAVSAARVPDTADHRQAEYFLRLLSHSRRVVDQRLDDYRKAIVASAVKGDPEATYSLRRMARAEEQDRRTIDGLIDGLHRRFPRHSVGEAPGTAARTRLAVR